MKKYIIGGVIIAAIVSVIWYFTRKKSAATQPGSGGTTAPAKLTEADFLALEKTFANGNPFEAEKVIKAAEISAVGENDPTPAPDAAAGSTKTQFSTANQFDNFVWTAILKVIRERNYNWIQQIEDSRFDPFSGPARAGYNKNLAQAVAYALRQWAATNYYYADATTQGSAQTINSPTGQSTPGIVWENTKLEYIKKATNTTTNPVTVYYFDLRNNSQISAVQAKSLGAI
jgi:hypothetical protein